MKPASLTGDLPHCEAGDRWGRPPERLSYVHTDNRQPGPP